MRALLTVSAAYVTCPSCGTSQADPETGSHAWDAEHLTGSLLCQNPGCCKRLDIGSGKTAKIDR